MLGKLLKYEFKSTARTLLPLYTALLILSVVSNLLMKSNFQTASVISITVFGALLMAVFIITLILMIQRFQKNLLEDEGYLMFTLPVKTNRLILAKMIATFVWFVVAWVVGGLSGLLISWSASFWPQLQEIWPQIMAAFSHITADQIGFIINCLLFVILGSFLFILMVYTSLSVSQLPLFHKHRRLFSFGTFIAILIVLQILLSIILPQAGTVAFPDVNQFMLLDNIFMAVADILLFIATNYILSKKLNLE